MGAAQMQAALRSGRRKEHVVFWPWTGPWRQDCSVRWAAEACPSLMARGRFCPHQLLLLRPSVLPWSWDQWLQMQDQPGHWPRTHSCCLARWPLAGTVRPLGQPLVTCPRGYVRTGRESRDLCHSTCRPGRASGGRGRGGMEGFLEAGRPALVLTQRSPRSRPLLPLTCRDCVPTRSFVKISAILKQFQGIHFN